jgi:hypothetical protein
MDLIRANVVELVANAVRTSTLTPTGIDISDYSGPAQIILQSSAKTAGTDPTLNVKVQECATVGGTYTDVVGAVFAEVTTADSTEMIAIKPDEQEPFMRVLCTIGGTSTPTFGFSVVMLATLDAGRNASQAV